MTLLIAKETKEYEPSELEKQLFGDNVALFLTATLIPLLGIMTYFIGMKVLRYIKRNPNTFDAEEK